VSAHKYFHSANKLATKPPLLKKGLFNNTMSLTSFLSEMLASSPIDSVVTVDDNAAGHTKITTPATSPLPHIGSPSQCRWKSCSVAEPKAGGSQNDDTPPSPPQRPSPAPRRPCRRMSSEECKDTTPPRAPRRKNSMNMCEQSFLSQLPTYPVDLD
jgi:hypothetical protein